MDREEWKSSQDQPKFSHKDNRCLHCAGDHETYDCPTRQQHQASSTSNHARGTGIYQNINQFSNTSPQHSSHSQQHSTKSVCCWHNHTNTHSDQPTISTRFSTSASHTSPTGQPTNYQVRPQQFNQQFTQPPLPQVSPLLMPPQPFNPQVPPPTFHNIHPLIALLWAVAILLSL